MQKNNQIYQLAITHILMQQIWSESDENFIENLP